MILIIDDDDAIRASLTFLLKRSGLTAKAVPGPKEALDEVRLQEPELILMDMNYSLSTTGEEGLELLRKIKIYASVLDGELQQAVVAGQVAEGGMVDHEGMVGSGLG